jgi:sulfate/thiosulfate transport system substrate-binding protein
VAGAANHGRNRAAGGVDHHLPISAWLIRARCVWLLVVLLNWMAGCDRPAPPAPSGASDKPTTETSVTEKFAAEKTTANPAPKTPVDETVRLQNVSYDPTLEVWKELNDAFAKAHEAATGKKVVVSQSHGGSNSQARGVLDGLPADVASLSLWPDMDNLREKGRRAAGWENRLPNRSLPWTSCVVFVVRKGNPKRIKDWPDIVREGVQVVTPNPKTSGNGRLSFLAAWGSVLDKGGTDEKARAFVTTMYRNAPTLDTGARGATSTFSQKGIGDVHLTMESEAYLEVAESGDDLEIVYPALSFLHEPHVAVVDAVVDDRGTRAVAEAYLKFLFTPEGQAIIAKHHFRPTDPEVLAKHKDEFPAVRLLTITDVAENWTVAQKKFFGDGGVFDQVYLSLK